MKKYTKILSLVLAMVMVLGLFAGCGGNGGNEETKGSESASTPKETKKPEEGKDDDKVLTFFNGGFDGVDKDYINHAIELFNSTTKSGYTVESVVTPNDQYKEKLVIEMSSGHCPDIYQHWAGGPMNEYVESGYAKPITELFNNSPLKDRLLPAGVEQAKYNGEIYAVPYSDTSMCGFYYNKDLFAKYGVEVPTTVGELEAACDTFLANGITPFALANSTKWTGSMYFMNLAARKGGLEPFNAAVAGTGSFEDECFIYAGNTIRDWAEKGYFTEGCNSLDEDDGQARMSLYTEDAAMILMGSWYTSVIKSESEEFYQKLGWFPFPALEGSDADPSITIGSVGQNFISFNCEGEKLEAAFEFASIFSSPEMVDYMVERGKMPPVVGVREKLTDEIQKTIFAQSEAAANIQLWYDQYLPPVVAQAHLDNSQGLFGLTTTAEEHAHAMQEAMQGYIADKQ